jgi:DNA-directed RNA polymerase specialized sigma24 family protein
MDGLMRGSPEFAPPASFAEELRLLLSNRNSTEARAFFQRILEYVDGRVLWVWKARCQDLVGSGEREEVVGQVMLELLSGALVRFRGETLKELLGYIRRITDRTLLHRARGGLRERRFGEAKAGELDWQVKDPDPSDIELEIEEVPLPESDQQYLLELARAGSMAEHARRLEVSRAAVTLRVQRIRSRIESMNPRDQASVEGWFRGALDELAQER